MTRAPDPERAGAPEGCSLSEPALAERIAWVRERIPPPREVRAHDGGFLLAFDDAAGLGETLAAWVALEEACCDPERIRFRLLGGAPAGTLHLAVHGVDPSGLWPDRPDASPRSARSGGCDTCQ